MAHLAAPPSRSLYPLLTRRPTDRRLCRGRALTGTGPSPFSFAWHDRPAPLPFPSSSPTRYTGSPLLLLFPSWLRLGERHAPLSYIGTTSAFHPPLPPPPTPRPIVRPGDPVTVPESCGGATVAASSSPCGESCPPPPFSSNWPAPHLFLPLLQL
jgi:hypothetical protein